MKIEIVDGKLFIEIETVLRIPIGLDLIRRDVPSGIELTIQEERCLRAVIAGKGNKEIAADMHLAERTVKFHISSLLHKFKCKTRGDLRRFMQASGRENWGKME